MRVSLPTVVGPGFLIKNSKFIYVDTPLVRAHQRHSDNIYLLQGVKAWSRVRAMESLEARVQKLRIIDSDSVLIIAECSRVCNHTHAN